MVYLLKLFKKVYLFKKVVFLISSGKNQIYHFWPPLEKILPTPMAQCKAFLQGKHCVQQWAFSLCTSICVAFPTI